MTLKRLTLSLAGGAMLIVSTAQAQTLLTLEGGLVDNTRNDVAVPGDTGTRFDFDEVSGADTGNYVRLELEQRWGDQLQHSARLVYAPLRVDSEGTLEETTAFDDGVFDAGPVETHYQFDAHRLTYRYRVYTSKNTRLQLGLTGLIRDAEIRLEQGEDIASKTNVGFVPLLHVKGDLILTRNWNLALEMDGLAAPQGRAFDVSLRGEYAFTDQISGYLGYRVLDGGVDNDEVYNFAQFQFGSVGLRLDFE